MKKFISLMLALVIVLSCFGIAFANESNDITMGNKETYVDQELGVVFERYVSGEDVLVLVKSLDGTIIDTTSSEAVGNVINSNGIILPLSITWGPWQPIQSVTIDTGGQATIDAATLLSITCPYVPLKALMAIAKAAATIGDEITISGRLRYGSDANFMYYERQTYFYADGVYLDMFEDSGRTNGGSIQSFEDIV